MSRVHFRADLFLEIELVERVAVLFYASFLSVVEFGEKRLLASLAPHGAPGIPMTIKVPAEEFSIIVGDEKLRTVGGEPDGAMGSDQLRDVSAVEYVPDVEGIRPEELMASIWPDDGC